MTRPIIRGVLQKNMDSDAAVFSASHLFDRKLYHYDIRGSIAWAKMLKRIGFLTSHELEKIIQALQSVEKEIESGRFHFFDNLEDIHMHVEASLHKKIGETAKKLHTGRSRNEQVSVDERLYCKDKIREITELLDRMQTALVEKAKQNVHIIMPGYTHLQQAQPVSAGHYFMAYVEEFQRDKERLTDILKRVDVLVLGSSALAGSTLSVDRDFLARELGFSRLSRNSMDAVSERDFVIELIFTCALIGTHLSRFAEDIIIWKSLEFDYISIGEEFCTGSSLMPQKSNPDIAELVRGKTARLYGNLVQILTLMKALPMAYNRDMQEDKESLFDSIETVLKSLKVFTGMIKTIRFNTDKIALHMSDFILSTDVAEYLVKKGVAFREAHDIVGKIVLFMKENGKRFCDMTLKDFKKFHRSFGEDVVSILSPRAAVDSRKLIGGTARKNVLQEIQKWKKKLG